MGLTNGFIGIGKLEAGLNLSLPKISATLTAAFGKLANHNCKLFGFHS